MAESITRLPFLLQLFVVMNNGFDILKMLDGKIIAIAIQVDLDAEIGH